MLLNSVFAPVLVVRGALAYYCRFGFHPSVEVGITPPFQAAGDYYLARPLSGYTGDYRGVVRYPATFRSVGYEAAWDYS